MVLDTGFWILDSGFWILDNNMLNYDFIQTFLCAFLDLVLNQYQASRICLLQPASRIEDQGSAFLTSIWHLNSQNYNPESIFFF